MTQAETSRHCKTCEQTVRCRRTAATPWALPHPPPTRQAFIVPRVHFTCFGPGSAWQHKLPTPPAASAAEAFGESALGACGLSYEGREHQAEPSATCTPGLGCSWVLAEHRRAAASLVRVFTAHSRPGHGHCRPQRLPAEPPGHRDGRQHPGLGQHKQAGGGGHRERKSAMWPAVSRIH